jgi:hypothetical protein
LKLLTNDINNYLQFYDSGGTKTNDQSEQHHKKCNICHAGKIEDAQATIQTTELPPFPADPLLFSHLMTNLLDNAINSGSL